MTKNEIKAFRQFLEERSVMLMFSHNYRIGHLTVNPASLKDYLEQAKAESVIPQAFVYPQGIYGKDFWLAIHQEWIARVRGIRDEQAAQHCLGTLDLEIIEVGQSSHSFGLPKDTCSLNIKGTGHRLTLNMAHSKMVNKKLATHLLLTRNRQTGDVVLMFNRERGIELKFRRGTSSLQINNAELAHRLEELLVLDVRQEYFLLHIEVLAETRDFLLFKVGNR